MFEDGVLLIQLGELDFDDAFVVRVHRFNLGFSHFVVVLVLHLNLETSCAALMHVRFNDLVLLVDGEGFGVCLSKHLAQFGIALVKLFKFLLNIFLLSLVVILQLQVLSG